MVVVAAVGCTHLILYNFFRDHKFMGDIMYRRSTGCDIANCRVLCTDST